MKLRKDSAFGIHFDFHALPGDVVADIYRPELIGQLLDRVQPDYVQFDTKGHPGLSSYPTKIGQQADEIKHDMLMHWREETKKRDIALYGHHSGIYDIHVAKTHPDWAVVDEDGNVSADYISVFSPYTDEILIPQLLELARDYALDGAWVDGDCWALYVDYSTWAQKAYYEASGISKLPKFGEEGYDDFVQFNQDGYKAYIKRYIDALKSEFPQFQITSNWIFSEFMPEKVSVPVDFLSGDYDSFDSVNSARHHGRFLAMQGIPWDLMSWGQNTKIVDWREVNRQNKEPKQLMQEAAVTLALGGGFEFFDIVYGHGGMIQPWCIEGWGEVADFVRAREKHCFKGKLAEEIGVIFTRPVRHSKTECVYPKNTAPVEILLSLQDVQMSTQFLIEDYADRFSNYKLLVLPKAETMRQSTIDALKNYVYNGGKLIVDLPSMQYFADVFNPNAPMEKQLVYVDGNGRLAAIETEVVLYKDDIAPQMYLNNYYEAESYAAHKCVSYGEGMFIFNLFHIADSCRINRSAPYNAYLKTLLKSADYCSPVRVLNSGFVDVTIAQKDEKYLVHLVNMCGTHNVGGVRSFAEIPPVCNLQIEIDAQHAPHSVSLMPSGDAVQYSYDGKTIHITIDKVEIYETIVIE